MFYSYSLPISELRDRQFLCLTLILQDSKGEKHMETKLAAQMYRVPKFAIRTSGWLLNSSPSGWLQNGVAKILKIRRMGDLFDPPSNLVALTRDKYHIRFPYVLKTYKKAA